MEQFWDERRKVGTRSLGTGDSGGAILGQMEREGFARCDLGQGSGTKSYIALERGSMRPDDAMRRCEESTIPCGSVMSFCQEYHDPIMGVLILVNYGPI